MELQVGVKALLKNAEGKFLILKRCEEKYGKTEGCWDIPGGRIDPGTPLMENLAREVEEETGLSFVGTPRLIAAQDIPFEDRHVVRLTYLGELGPGEPALDMEEHEEYRFARLDELREGESVDRYVREVLSRGVVE